MFLVLFRKIDGLVICFLSTGSCGFKGKKKRTPNAITKTSFFFCKRVKERLKKLSIDLFKIKINLHLYGLATSFLVKEACKGLQTGGLKFMSIVDNVKVAHSLGRTKKKARRV
jgi:ribosomal protein S11